MTLTDTLITPLAVSLLACLDTQMQRHSSPPTRVELRAGSAASPVMGVIEDECCAGLAWVRPVSALPGGADPPGGQTELRNCGPYNWVLTFELGVARCAPWGSGPDDLEPLTEAQWLSIFDYQMQDFVGMSSAAQCCFNNTADRYFIGQWQPSEIEGGCTASMLTVTVLANRDCAVVC